MTLGSYVVPIGGYALSEFLMVSVSQRMATTSSNSCRSTARSPYGSLGSPGDRPLFRFIAGKLPLNSDTSKRPFATVSNRPLGASHINKRTMSGARQFADIPLLYLSN